MKVLQIFVHSDPCQNGVVRLAKPQFTANTFPKCESEIEQCNR